MQKTLHQGQHIPSALLPFMHPESIVASSPGRINLIGEHTDYNDGFVLPAAINKCAYIVLTPRHDDHILLRAVNKNEQYETTIHTIHPLKNHWANYLLGVVAAFQKRQISVKGFEATMISDVPMGAGLSSSAAIECAMAGALNTYCKSNLPPIQMVQIAQQAEHTYAGVLCGIMDQYASVFGKKNHAIRLDCRSLEHAYQPLDLQGCQIILLDTSIKHNLASSEYNTRRSQCQQGVEWVKEKYPQVVNLRDVTKKMLDECVLQRDAMIYDRCKYVVQENERLLMACDFLQQKDFVNFGKKMFETHEGLSQLYAVSCKELDALVLEAKKHPAVIGARMMGGGFGGCTINLIQQEQAKEVSEQIKKAYEANTQLHLKVYEVSIENGLQIFE